MSKIYGVRRENWKAHQLSTIIESILDDAGPSLPTSKRIILIPDLHYPYHPSTGQVTNPEIINAITASLRSRRTEITVAIGVRDSTLVEGMRTARYLGYKSVTDQEEVEFLQLDEVEHMEINVEMGDESKRYNIPTVLNEEPVMVVPTLRASEQFGVAASMVALATAAVGKESLSQEDITPLVSHLDPELNLFDGSYIHATTPWKLGLFLFAKEITSLDIVLANDLLGLQPTEIDYLKRVDRSERARAVSGAELSELPDGIEIDMSQSTSIDGLLNKGYQIYTTISGDALPPQFSE